MFNLIKLCAVLAVFGLSVVSVAEAHHGGWNNGPRHGWNNGWRGPRPGPWGPGPGPWAPGYNPGYIGPGYGPAYGITCFAVNNVGVSFYGISGDPGTAQAIAMNVCASAGSYYCQPTGCR